ncbi:MAG: endonuclease/exonuclease/phosphatase family protein [Pseudomonadota bacterium]
MVAINEIRTDQTGTDNDEYFELFGASNASLDGLTYVVIGDGTGGSGVIESVTDLSGLTLDADGFFLAAEASFTLGTADLTTVLDFENSDNVTHLLVQDFTGSDGQDLDTNDDGILDVTPWTSVEDSVALIETIGSGDLVYSLTTVGPSGSSVPGHVFRETDGTGDFQIGGFTAPTDDTPGVSNSTPPATPTDATIMEIQGAGHISPLLGELVTTGGVVTAVDNIGFYIQDPTGDGDIATSDAVFVFTGSAPSVAVGNEVTVTGTVSEFTPGGSSSGNLSTTQVGADLVTVVTESADQAAPVILGEGGRLPPNDRIDNDPLSNFDPVNDGIDFFESLEGMRVTATDLVAVTGTNRFGEIFAVTDGGDDATGLSERGTLNISPDDFNPEKIQIDSDFDVSGFDLPEVDVGAELGDVTGVVGYGFGNFEIIPTVDFTSGVIASDIAPEVTGLTGTLDELTVATYNVLNLETNDADGDTDVADGRFDVIAQQIITNLASPDIIGLQEIQDNSGSEDDGVTSASDTLQALVDAISAAGGPDYVFIDNTFITDGASGGQPGGNIRTAFLYDPSRVDLVPGSVQPVGSQDSGQAFNGARLPLAASFVFNGEEVTVVNNHLSSKGGSSPILGTTQPFEDLQEDPNVNGSLDERREQAQAVNDFVDTVLDSDPDANVIVLGDMNEFEFVSPLDILAGTVESANAGESTVPGGPAILSNLTDLIPEDERYTFIFQGNSQSLDHILTSFDLLGSAEVDIVHVNTEFAEVSGRGSDHDPVVASFTIEAPSLQLSVDFVPFLKGSIQVSQIDGSIVDAGVFDRLENDVAFDALGIDLTAVDPTNVERLSFRNGELGIRSVDDRGQGFERRAVDGDEVLQFDLDTADFGLGVEADFEFAQVRNGDQVQLAYYQDGVLVETQTAEVGSGDSFESGLVGATFDRVDVSAVGDTAFQLDAFEFRVLDDPLTDIV